MDERSEAELGEAVDWIVEVLEQLGPEKADAARAVCRDILERVGAKEEKR